MGDLTLQVDNNYVPGQYTTIKEKSIWTERRLQKLQRELIAVFKKCESNCNLCKERPCDKIVEDMEKYLIPYGLSIFKGAFKRRATCEEMDRVVRDSISALLMDIWHRKKVIHTSFGSMLKWKMVYFLDGNINLFDTKKVQSLSAMIDKFPTSNIEDNGKDIIEHYRDVIQMVPGSMDSYIDVYRKDVILSILDLLSSSIDTYNKFTNPREKYVIYIKSLFAFKRFINNESINLLFKNDNKSRFYFTKLIDTIKKYLIEFDKLK